MIESNERSCDGCNKCCEGWLSGEAHGYNFYKGKPCHFMTSNGCAIYKDRPEDPCKTYKCEWLVNNKIPYWMKPDKANIIITARKNELFEYLSVEETGSVISAKILNWLILYALSNQINLEYNVEGGTSRIGEIDFANFADRNANKSVL